MASATGAPFDSFPSGTTQSSAPQRRANGHQTNLRHRAVDLAASVPGVPGRLRLPRQARHLREWATSPRRYRVRVGRRTASVSDNVLDLLALIDGERTIPELADALGNRQGRWVHPMEVAYLIHERLAPAGLVRIREPQWASAPALPALNQPEPWAAPAFALAPAPATGQATGPLPSPAPGGVDELAAIDKCDTIVLDPQAPAPPPAPQAIPMPASAELPPALPDDDAPTVVVPRLPDTVSPADDEVYVDEQPTMLLTPVEALSAPTALQFEPAEPDAQESPTVMVRPRQAPATASAGPNPVEPLSARVATARSTVGQALGRVDEHIGLVATRAADERSLPASTGRQVPEEVQRAASIGLPRAQAEASAVALPGDARVRRTGLWVRIAGEGVAGMVLLGLALALAIASQKAHQAHHAIMRHAVSPTPTPLQERILPGETAYSVRPGDTLASIASAHHISQDALLLVNADILTGPSALLPGMRLAIPAVYQPPLPASVQPRPLYYVVQGGDTLYMIGQRFGLDWHVIANYNHVTDPRTLAVGQGLVIPAAGQ
jgi:LysM repeat protein